MKRLFLLVILLNLCSLAEGQDYLEDSMFKTIDLRTLDKHGVYDSLDIMEGDFFDTGFDANLIAVTDADWTKYWCRRKDHITANRDIDLRKNDWNYIRIYYDDFNLFDRNFWQNKNINGTNNWDYFIDWGDPCNNNSNKNKAINLNENESVSDGKLNINIKHEPRTIPWNYKSNSYDPNPWVTSTRKFDYSTARVESTWGFDGSMDVLYNNDGTTTLSEDEGGLCIISKIKHPIDKGLLPAFWLMGYYPTSYEEFDIFEYFNEDGKNADNMAVTMHSGHGSPDARYMCQENRDIDNPSNFHIYTFFWNAFNVRTYLDDKKQAVYSRHQFSRDNRIGAWPQELENNKVYNIRKKYSRYPMRINFSNNVYCSLDNKHLDAKYEVDYIAIYKKYPCAKDELFDQDSDLKIKDGVYNVAIAKKAIFNFPIGASNPIPPNQMFKLIANDVVDITNMSVGVWSNLIIEPTNEDLCANQLPEIGDGPEPPPNVNMNNNSLNLKTLDLSRLETIVNKKVPYHRQVGKKLEIINLDVYDQFFIFDAQGRLVYSINRNDNVNKVILDLSNYTNGVYYVQGIDSTRRKDKISFPIYLNND